MEAMRKRGNPGVLGRFLKEAWKVAAPNQRTSAIWLLGKEGTVDLAQDTGELVFTFRDRIIRAPAQILGSFDSRDTLGLAWANSSVTDSLARDSRQVRECGEQHNRSASHNTSMAG